MENNKGIKPQREDYVNALKEIDVYTDIMVEDIMDIHIRAEKYARMRRTESLRVSDLMSQPVKTVKTDCSLAEAAHILTTHKISGLPVVDEQQQLVGVITEADFLRALGVPGHHPTHNLWQTLEAMFTPTLELKEPDDASVADLMTRDVISITPDHTLHDLLEEMKKNRIKRVVVCDEAHHVIGMVTRSDLVRLFFDRIKKAGTTRE
ncbi:HPP family protein [Sulfuriflexus mobilis]|uniref:CBS domain-containing protein n=1 Tax=Sulfuriflexus mobilis TaxID=1811807 RepID=UPI000F8338BE|nr:CBS domain-containing protein [Sulfuriflexus mobilis]